jgi:hypothetical protein
MTYSLAQLRKAITARRQAEGCSQPSSAMLSAHLQKHRAARRRSEERAAVAGGARRTQSRQQRLAAVGNTPGVCFVPTLNRV